MTEGAKDNIRLPVVADRFYPGDEKTLRQEVTSRIGTSRGSETAIGAVLPHAGYVYSGDIAGKTIAAITIPRVVVILGPNHTRRGPAVSVYPSGFWRMPFGDIPVNEGLAGELFEHCDLAVPDEMAHLMEHSIEVQIPFLFYGGDGDLSILPITISRLDDAECRLVGKCLADIISRRDERILIAASSDMTHYESQESARAKDSEALARILSLDPEGLLRIVRDRRISMCGVIPSAVMLYASIALGASQARLIRYGTSGDVSGDYQQVVGYAGVVVQ
ncbi:MAG: AmmeMemoRadiSam system protein B [Proteobacteria bacterium]|nr:AmmeMemoRadiSam system protein B [Pseudomonadota bacterium]